MLHSDTLANEFNEILNAAEIFAPFQPLDPAVTFYAPLRNNVRDLRLNQDDFQRASDAWYKDGSGIYRNVGINRARFEQSRLLMEPAKTNKCLNYNANPDAAFTNVILSGDAAATLTRVSDVAELAAAGLQDICSDGNVLRLNNTAGSTIANAQVAGDSGNTNLHTLSVFWRGSGLGHQRFSGPAGTSVPIPPNYERDVATVVPPDASRSYVLTVEAGADVFFILNQLEESAVVTSPIVTEGTAGQRAEETLLWLDSNLFFPQAQGMIFLDWFPRIGSASMTVDNHRLVSTGGTFNQLYHTNDRLKSLDESGNNPTSVIDPFTAGDFIRCAILYGPAGPGVFECGNYHAGGWAWTGLAVPYGGSFRDDGVMGLGQFSPYSHQFSNLAIYNENRGRQWVEDNLTP